MLSGPFPAGLRRSPVACILELAGTGEHAYRVDLDEAIHRVIGVGAFDLTGGVRHVAHYPAHHSIARGLIHF